MLEKSVMDRSPEAQHREARARRRAALQAAVELLVKLKAAQARLSGAPAGGLKGSSAAAHAIDQVTAAIERQGCGLEDLLCELARLLAQLQRELDDRERLHAAAVMYQLAAQVSESGQATVLRR